MEGIVAPPPGAIPRVTEEAVHIAARLRSLAGKGKVIAFTSAGAGEGATAVACAVATALAQMDMGQVLVLDANFASPSTHVRFGLPRAPGLADVLAGAASFEQGVRATPIDRLSLLPLGTPVPEGAMLRTVATLPAVLSQARQRFETVLVDAPSFVRSAVAPVVLAECDAVVLVVAAGAHKRGELQDLRRHLDEAGARLLGVVLSNARM